MSRNLSSNLVSELLAAQSGEALLVLIEIGHSSFTTPLRVTSDGVNTVSNGNTFVPFPFQLKLPNEMHEREPRATLQVSNVDRTIVQALRNAPADELPTVSMQIVRASTPNTVEANFPGFELASAEYNRDAVQGELIVERFATEPFPSQYFTPGLFPALFSQ